MMKCPVCGGTAKTLGQWFMVLDPTDINCSSCGAALRFTRKAWGLVAVIFVLMLAGALVGYFQSGRALAVGVTLALAVVFQLLGYFLIDLEAVDQEAVVAEVEPRVEVAALVWARRVVLVTCVLAGLCELMSWRMSDDFTDLAAALAYPVLGFAGARALTRGRRATWWGVTAITGGLTLVMLVVLALWSDIVVALFTDEAYAVELEKHGQNLWDAAGLAVFAVGAAATFALLMTRAARAWFAEASDD